MRKKPLFRRSFLPAILCVLLVSPAGSVAEAASLKLEAATSTPYVVDMLAEATVNLYCRFKTGNKIISASGSGVFISERGVILTNAHVAQFFLLAREEGRVTGECTIRTGSPAKSAYSASILYIPPVWLEENASKISEREPKGTGENDFALLFVSSAQQGASPPNRFSSLPADVFATASEEDAVVIAGYPSEQLDFNSIRSKLMEVVASSTVTQVQSFDLSHSPDLISLAPSAAARAGVSGGPIVGAEGELLGIVAVKSSSKENPSLRGISISYINRALYLQTGLALPSFLAGDFARLASSTRASISEKSVRELESGLRKRK